MNLDNNEIKNLNEKIEFLTIDFKDISKSILNYLWTLNFRRLSRNRLAQCDYNKKIIELNKDFLEIRPLMEFQDILRHEVAHAVVFERYKFNENWRNIKPHGKEWQDIALSLGAIPKRCSNKSKNRPKFNYWLECPTHGVVNSWIKKPYWFDNEIVKRYPEYFFCDICKNNGNSKQLELMRNT